MTGPVKPLFFLLLRVLGTNVSAFNCRIDLFRGSIRNPDALSVTVSESDLRPDPKEASELLPLVYIELRKLAASQMANQPPGQTLQPTALVHEAWPRLHNSGGWRN